MISSAVRFLPCLLVGAVAACGSKQSGSDVATGGTAGSGGTAAPTMGGTNSGAPSGGTSSGGSKATTGGVSSGGAPTGGSTAVAGGNAGGGNSGGASAVTGGASTGGASAGGSGGASAGAAGTPSKACDASKAPALGALGLENVVTSAALKTASYAIQPPESDDWYLVEQSGKIHVLVDGALRPEPFLDVSSQVTLDPTYDERGLHSIAFAPDYAASGLFYVVFTPTSGTRANRDLLLEYRRSAANEYASEADPARELMSLEGAPQSGGMFANIHNAYQAKFGPDGMLYVGMGDGGGTCNDNPGFEDTPQDIASPYGKLLRFDVKAAAPHGAADNPFVGMGDARVFHYGLRNPYRFSWDPVTLDLYIGEVGQDSHEEINVAPAGSKGLNFGWASFEGDEATCPGHAQRAGSTLTEPIFFTEHGGGGFRAACSTSPFCDYGAIVGGAVYRGSVITQLSGAYVFGDWAGNNMAALYHCGEETSEVTVIDYVRDANVPSNGYLVRGQGVAALEAISAIVEDHARELYLVANGNSLLKIVPAP